MERETPIKTTFVTIVQATLLLMFAILFTNTCLINYLF